MHNIHYVVVNAESPREAVRTVLDELDGWGNENNWRSPVGVFTRTGKVYTDDLCDSDHFTMKGHTVKKTNRVFTEKLSIPDFGWKPTEEIMAGIVQTLQELAATGLEPKKLHAYIRKQLKEKNGVPIDKLYHLSEAMRAMTTTISAMDKRRAFDLWKDEYRPYEFDEVGVTHYDSEDGEQYCVLIDVHS